MKRPNQILSIAFLLVLLISSIFAISATEYSVSEQSITSISETLPDDIFFYSDGDFPTLVFAVVGWDVGKSGGTGDYESTHEKDSTFYYGYDSTPAGNTETYLNFTEPIGTNWNMSINFYGHCRSGDGAVTTKDLLVWNGAAYIDIGNLVEDNSAPYDDGSGWINWTTIDTDYWESGTVTIKVLLDDAADVYFYIDYVEVVFLSPIVLSEDSYAESFADVDDWAESDTYPWEAGESISTDGDVGTFSAEGDGDNDIDGFYTNVSLVTVPYFEIRYKLSSLDADFVYLYCVQDGTDPHISLVESTEWVTRGVKIDEWIGPAPPTNPTEILIIIRADADFDIDIEIDYDRAGPVNESGWQHDGSSIHTVTEYYGDISSDGDSVSITGDEEPGCGIFWVDPTSTKAVIESSYYPFIGLNVTNVDGALWNAGYSTTNVPTVWSDFSWFNIDETDSGIFRFNIESLDIDPSNIAILVQDGTLEVQWIQAYSIANYTVTQSGTSIDDVLYVDSGVLYCEGTSFTSIVLAYDPVLSFETERSMWTMTTSSGTPDIDFYFDAWLGYTSNTEGNFPDGTLTAFRIKFTYSANIEAITSLSPIPQWNIVGEAELIFSVPLDETGLDMMLIFLGLLMIPASTLYLVKGGRSEASMDKLFFGLIAFVLGWALFLGGIM